MFTRQVCTNALIGVKFWDKLDKESCWMKIQTQNIKNHKGKTIKQLAMAKGR